MESVDTLNMHKLSEPPLLHVNNLLSIHSAGTRLVTTRIFLHIKLLAKSETQQGTYNCDNDVELIGFNNSNSDCVYGTYQIVEKQFKNLMWKFFA